MHGCHSAVTESGGGGGGLAECFLQMKTPSLANRPIQYPVSSSHPPSPSFHLLYCFFSFTLSLPLSCPFCKVLPYAVEFRGGMTSEEKGLELAVWS